MVGAAATLVYNIPGHSVNELVFIPVDFAVAWVAGLAVREQAEVAESRATQAEHCRAPVPWARHAGLRGPGVHGQGRPDRHHRSWP
jgi:hypothetical protein